MDLLQHLEASEASVFAWFIQINRNPTDSFSFVKGMFHLLQECIRNYRLMKLCLATHKIHSQQNNTNFVGTYMTFDIQACDMNWIRATTTSVAGLICWIL